MKETINYQTNHVHEQYINDYSLNWLLGILHHRSCATTKNNIYRQKCSNDALRISTRIKVVIYILRVNPAGFPIGNPVNLYLGGTYSGCSY